MELIWGILITFHIKIKKLYLQRSIRSLLSRQKGYGRGEDTTDS